MKIEISKITVGERIRKDPGDIKGLAESIREEGLQSPIILRKLKDDSYKLLAGWRRLEAHKMLERVSIEAAIRKQP